MVHTNTNIDTGSQDNNYFSNGNFATLSAVYKTCWTKISNGALLPEMREWGDGAQSHLSIVEKSFSYLATSGERWQQRKM